MITNSVPEVLARGRRAWESHFDVAARIESRSDGCPQVMVHAKALVQFTDHLGCGSRSSNKRIPRVIMEGTQANVLAFLQGIALDAYVTTGAMAKWAICVDSAGLLDDVQLLLTRLGVVHRRIEKWNSKYQKQFGEVYVCGAKAQPLLSLVAFMEPDKAARAHEMRDRRFSQNPWDAVPGLAPRELADMLPKGRPGRSRRGTSMAGIAFLRDPRTKHVSRRSLERVATVPAVSLPDWLDRVLDENWRFSPIVQIAKQLTWSLG